MATNDSKNARSAMDLPHGMGSTSYAMASMKGEGGKGSNKGNVRSVLLLTLASQLWSSDAGRQRRRQRQRQGKPSGLPHATLYSRGNGRIRRGHPKSIALNAVDFADTANWAPRPWRPTRTRSNCRGAVTEAVQAHSSRRPIVRLPPAPFPLPEDAASKGAPALRAPVHVTHDPRATRA